MMPLFVSTVAGAHEHVTHERYTNYLCFPNGLVRCFHAVVASAYMDEAMLRHQPLLLHRRERLVVQFAS